MRRNTILMRVVLALAVCLAGAWSGKSMIQAADPDETELITARPKPELEPKALEAGASERGEMFILHTGAIEAPDLIHLKQQSTIAGYGRTIETEVNLSPVTLPLRRMSGKDAPSDSGDVLYVKKQDNTIEHNFVGCFDASDKLAHRYVPDEDFLLAPPYWLEGLHICYVDWAVLPGVRFEVVGNDHGLPDLSDNLASVSIDLESDGAANWNDTTVSLGHVRVDDADTIWVVAHIGDAGGGNLSVGGDTESNTEIDDVWYLAGTSRRYRDSYAYCSTYGWFPINDEYCEIADWTNLSLTLIVGDSSPGDHNLCQEDLINAQVVPGEAHSRSTVIPQETFLVGDSVGLLQTIVNNSTEDVGPFDLEISITEPDAEVDTFVALVCDTIAGGNDVRLSLPGFYHVQKVGLHQVKTVVTVDTSCDTATMGPHDDEKRHNDTLSCTFLVMAGPDPYEPNDDGEHATSFTLGDTLGDHSPPADSLNVHHTADVDYFVFAVLETKAGECIVTLDVDAAGISPLDPQMTLLDEHGSELFYCGDDPRDHRDPYIRFRLEPGTYYLRVGSHDGSLGPYRLETRVDYGAFDRHLRNCEALDLSARETVSIADGAWKKGTSSIYWVEVGGGNDIVRYDTTTCSAEEFIDIVGFHPASTRGIAYDTRGQGSLWIGDWNERAIFHLDLMGNLLRRFDVDESVAGLSIDHDNNHLWAVTNDSPDEFIEYDIADTSALIQIQRFDVPWRVPRPWPELRGLYCGAGLAYDDDEDLLVAVNQFWLGVGNDVEYFTDVGPAYDGTGPEPGVDTLRVGSLLNETGGAWGVAEIDGHLQNEFWVMDMAGSYWGIVGTPGIFPVHIYGRGKALFVRGDADADGDHDIFDGLRIIYWLGGAADPPPCVNAADVTDDEAVDIFDGLRVIYWIGGVADPPPPPCCETPAACGPDPTPEALTCESYPPCGWNRKPVATATSVGRAEENRLAVGQAVVEEESVVVLVSLVNAEALVGFSWSLEYDPELVKATAVDNAGLVTEEFAVFVGGVREPGLVRVVAVSDLEVGDGVEKLPAGEHEVAWVIFEVRGTLDRDVNLDLTDGVMAMDHDRALNHRLVDGLVKPSAELPREFCLSQNYPNPFNPATKIGYALPRDCHVRLEVYNLLGQRVATLVDECQKADYKTVRWDSRSHESNEVASGIYFYRLQAEDFVDIKKMLLIR